MPRPCAFWSGSAVLACCCAAVADADTSAELNPQPRFLLQDYDAEDDPAFSWTWRTALMLLLTFLVSALSMPAGIGGGIVFVPMINLLLQFSMSQSAAASQAFILGGALGSAYFTLARRHPQDVARPLIDFGVLLLLLPLMLAGVAGGVILNSIFPNWILTILLLLVLLWQTTMSALKSWALTQKERVLVQQHTAAPPPVQPSAIPASPFTGGADLLRRSTAGSSLGRRSSFSNGLVRLSSWSIGEVPLPEWSCGEGMGVAGGSGQGESERLLLSHSLQLHSSTSCGAGQQQQQQRRERQQERHRTTSTDSSGRSSWDGQLIRSSSMPAAMGTAGSGRAAATAAGAPVPTLCAQQGDVFVTKLARVEEGSLGDSPNKPAVFGAAVCSDTGWDLPAAGTQRGSTLRACVADLWRSMAGELFRLPRFDRRTLWHLASVGAIWAGFVAFQATRAVTSNSMGSRCFAAYYAMLAMELVLLLAAAAGSTAHVIWKRRRQVQRPIALEAHWGSSGGSSSYELPASAAGGLTASIELSPQLAAAGKSAQGLKGAAVGQGTPRGAEKAAKAQPAATGAGDAAAAAVAATVGSSAVEGSGTWSLQKILVVQCIALVGGTLATMLGLGGGLVMGPLLLALDLHPLVASATSSFMVLLTVSSATISYAIQGRLSLDYSLIFGASCFVGAFLGVAVVNHLVKKTGATSLVVVLMTVVVGAGAIICAAYSMPRAVDDLRTGTDTDLGSFCHG